jgi:phage repressor protein C with HTH and peptisase S24 domain
VLFRSHSETEAGSISKTEATALVPPRSSIICESVFMRAPNCSAKILGIPKRQSQGMPNPFLVRLAEMKTWHERLQEALAESGMTQTELASRVGVSSASVSDWLSGKSKDIKGSHAYKIERALNISLAWLFDNEGPKRLTDTTTDSVRVVAVTHRAIPLSASIHGQYIHVGEDDTKEPMYYQASWIKSMGFKPECLVVRLVKGSSMEPALHDGDSILINCASRKPIHGRTFWVTVEGEACVKRILKLHGSWWISSDNSAHKTRDIQLENIDQIMGEVVIKSTSHI